MPGRPRPRRTRRGGVSQGDGPHTARHDTDLNRDPRLASKMPWRDLVPVPSTGSRCKSMWPQLASSRRRPPPGSAGRVFPATRNKAPELLEAIVDAALGEVVRRHLDLHLVAGQNTNAVLAHLSCRVRDDLMAVLEFDPECRVRQQFLHDAGEFEKFFLGHVISCLHTRKGTGASKCAPPTFFSSPNSHEAPARQARPIRDEDLLEHPPRATGPSCSAAPCGEASRLSGCPDPNASLGWRPRPCDGARRSRGGPKEAAGRGTGPPRQPPLTPAKNLRNAGALLSLFKC